MQPAETVDIPPPTIVMNNAGPYGTELFHVKIGEHLLIPDDAILFAFSIVQAAMTAAQQQVSLNGG